MATCCGDAQDAAKLNDGQNGNDAAMPTSFYSGVTMTQVSMIFFLALRFVDLLAIRLGSHLSRQEKLSAMLGAHQLLHAMLSGSAPVAVRDRIYFHGAVPDSDFPGGSRADVHTLAVLLQRAGLVRDLNVTGVDVLVTRALLDFVDNAADAYFDPLPHWGLPVSLSIDANWGTEMLPYPGRIAASLGRGLRDLPKAEVRHSAAVLMQAVCWRACELDPAGPLADAPDAVQFELKFLHGAKDFFAIELADGSNSEGECEKGSFQRVVMNAYERGLLGSAAFSSTTTSIGVNLAMIRMVRRAIGLRELLALHAKA